MLGKEEWEKMLKWYEGEWYEEMMPKGISKAKREIWGFSKSDGWLKRKLVKIKG